AFDRQRASRNEPRDPSSSPSVLLSRARRTRLEHRPVEALDVSLVRRENIFEIERELRWPVLFEMCKTLLRFVNARHMSWRNPPESQVGAAELLEPVAALSQQLRMCSLVDVRAKRFDALPDRKIEQNAIVVVRTQVRRIPRLGLQSPNESRTPIGESVDLLEPFDEAGHDGILERGPHPADVDLGDVVLRHH